MRKGLFITLLVASALVIAVLVTAGTLALGSGHTLGSTRPAELTLSFKPFTVGDLLHMKTEVDIASSGKEIHSAKLTQIEERTSALRGLPLKKPVKFVELPESALRVQLLDEFNKDTPASQVDADQKLLVALGLFPANENLQTVELNVYTEQIAGSYDSKTKEITIVAGKGTNSAEDELTMSHEITHALQDQNFGLDKSPLDNKDYNGDNDTSVTSLVEGDATVTMVLYGRKYMTTEQLRSLSNQEVSSHELDTAPTYIRKSVLFPYEQGMTFAQALYDSGGEAAIDKALANPPLSTEQILHPDKYMAGNDNPRAVPLADISASLGEGWSKINEDCMGEFDNQVWFEEYTGTETASEVANGWGGNTIQYYQGPGKNYVLVNDTVWDTTKDAGEFFNDYAKLLEGRFKTRAKKVGSTDTAYTYAADGQLFYCGIAGDATLNVQARDRVTLVKALANYPQFPAAP